MLHEILPAEQFKGDLFRRCFQDENLFLVVWYQEDKSLYGFQLTFGRDGKERVLTWMKDRGVSRSRIDYGAERHALHPSPLLLDCDDFNGTDALAALNLSWGSIPLPEKAFIQEALAAA